jgi:hypothetical protein
MALCLNAKTPLWQFLLGCLVYLAPFALLSPAAHWFLYAIPETLLFAAIIRLALARPNGALMGNEPNPVPAPQP